MRGTGEIAALNEQLEEAGAERDKLDDLAFGRAAVIDDLKRQVADQEEKIRFAHQEILALRKVEEAARSFVAHWAVFGRGWHKDIDCELRRALESALAELEAEP